jgi:hypothetical protein
MGGVPAGRGRGPKARVRVLPSGARRRRGRRGGDGGTHSTHCRVDPDFLPESRACGTWSSTRGRRAQRSGRLWRTGRCASRCDDEDRLRRSAQPPADGDERPGRRAALPARGREPVRRRHDGGRHPAGLRRLSRGVGSTASPIGEVGRDADSRGAPPAAREGGEAGRRAVQSSACRRRAQSRPPITS